MSKVAAFGDEEPCTPKESVTSGSSTITWGRRQRKTEDLAATLTSTFVPSQKRHVQALAAEK